jgi:hypothetical protein
MPHMFTNRSRSHDLTRARADLRAQYRWETINAVIYKIGGHVLIVGSIRFFPRCRRLGAVYGGLGSFPLGGQESIPEDDAVRFPGLAAPDRQSPVFWGGVFNYGRAYLVVWSEMKGRKGSKPNLCGSLACRAISLSKLSP